MIAHLSHVMTLANSIIGVSVLAMPFCFKQCGIILAILVLLTSSVLSRLACHFLIKSAVMSRRRNFEFLAFHAFGTTGKFLVELFIIGFLLGTCIAFFVVVGDLGPQIIGKMLNKTPEDIRNSVLVTTATFIVFPLGLLRNIDSLSSVCTATIGFYLCLVLKVIGESTRHIFLGDWYERVVYWRPAGILQCLPIFSMALFCQTQLFEIYEAIPNVCLEKMNQVVRGALNICTAVYLCVGFFGYVAFCTQPFTGNILMSFEPSLTSDVIKMGFVFSVAFSFPLVIFPCRASLNSLLFRGAHGHDPANNYIPEVRFRWLTFAIVSMSLGTGILIPNIEFLLGIVGSTIGVMICLIFPAAFFIAISTKNTNERLIAQGILFLGMWIMVLGTYANIYAIEDSPNSRFSITTGKPMVIGQFNDLSLSNILKEDFSVDKMNILLEEKEEIGKKEEAKEILKTPNVRREPPIPVEREILTEKSLIDTKLAEAVSHLPLIGQKLRDAGAAKVEPKSTNEADGKSNQPPGIVASPASQETAKNKINDEEKSHVGAESKNENLIDSDAIKKEERELEAAAGEVDSAAEARHEKLRQTLEKHKLEQMEMMQEQKELLKDIKEQKHELEALELVKNRLADEENKLDQKIEKIEKNIPKIVELPVLKEEVVFQAVGILDEQGKGNLVSGEKETRRNEKIVRRQEEPPPVVKIIIVNDEKSLKTEQIPRPKENTLREEKTVPPLPAKMLDHESRGPILNALTNWTVKKSNDANIEWRNVQANSTANSSKSSSAVEKAIPIDLPIALRMSEKSKNTSSIEKSLKPLSDNQTLDDNSPLRRDILQHRDVEKRGKRETRESHETDKTHEEIKEEDKNSKSPTKEQCEMRLSNQNSTNITHENVAILKKRDLKEFQSER